MLSPRAAVRILGAPLEWPLYPSLLAAWIVLSQYAAVLPDPAAVTRPLVIAVVAATAVTLIGWASTRRRHFAGLVGASIILAVASKPVVSTIAELASVQPIASLVLVGALVAAVIVGTRIIVGIRPSASRLTRMANSVVLLGLGIATVQVVMALSSDQPSESSPTVVPTGELPDIYVLIPDAYPGAATLERVFGHDNEPFLRALETRGFTVDRESHSNYWFTSLTLASMLQMRHVVDDPAYSQLLDGAEGFHPGWRQQLNSNVAFEVLRQHGYEIHATDSGWEELAFRSADAFVDSDAFNDLEVALMRGTYVGDILDVVGPGIVTSSYRQLVTDAFEAIELHATAASDRPRFLLSHLPAPHRPFGFDEEGEPVEWDDIDAFHGVTPERMEVSPEAYGALQVGQIRWMNDRLLSTIDTILTESEGTAVILLLSDHGPGNHQPGMAGINDAAALFRNLFAARTPGETPFEAPTTPVSALSRLFNAYFGTALPIASNQTYAVGMITTPSGALRGIAGIAPLPVSQWMETERAP